jgi:hypothetical protein
MSSEEMRIELERFVNTGLREGWRGWPLKAESRESGARSLETGEARRQGFQVQNAGRLAAFGTVRLFDWERKWIRVGTRLVFQESNS